MYNYWLIILNKLTDIVKIEKFQLLAKKIPVIYIWYQSFYTQDSTNLHQPCENLAKLNYLLYLPHHCPMCNNNNTSVALLTTLHINWTIYSLLVTFSDIWQSKWLEGFLYCYTVTSNSVSNPFLCWFSTKKLNDSTQLF